MNVLALGWRIQLQTLPTIDQVNDKLMIKLTDASEPAGLPKIILCQF